MMIKHLNETDPLVSPGRQTAQRIPSKLDWEDDDPRNWVRVPDRPTWIEYNTRTGMWRNAKVPPLLGG